MPHVATQKNDTHARKCKRKSGQADVRKVMSSFSVATLQEKLSRLSASQESIETLSLWIIHHKAFAQTSVTVWADSFTKGE